MTGIFNVDKPAGMTSAAVVARVKRLTGGARVGHMGTLDPQGTGVLLIGVGRGTRLFDQLLKKDKVYRAEFTFGYETDTLDGDGTVTATTDRKPSVSEIAAELLKLTGKLSQYPPKYSAKSIDGVRAYKLAREQAEFQLKPAEVEVFRFSYLQQTAEDAHQFEIECSSGTYIRSLCRDLAAHTGSLATMTSIRRMRAGAFRVEDSVTLEELAKNPAAHLLPIEYAIQDLPVVEMPIEKFDLLKNGVKIYADPIPPNSRIYCGGVLFGIGSVHDGRLELSARLIEEDA